MIEVPGENFGFFSNYILQQCCFFLHLPTYEASNQLGRYGYNNVGCLCHSLRHPALVFFFFTPFWC